MVTRHNQILADCRKMAAINDEAVHLIVTSPPYPMIEMWDGIFTLMNNDIEKLLRFQPENAFEKMHSTLDEVWQEAYRVLAPGGFLCLNIGDATRSIGGQFRLFANHARILQKCMEIGFTNLPPIIWRKPTNAPNKFMGSGMLPAGAYVTYEHEYILIMRKGAKRDFSKNEQKLARNASAYFWEERNTWFSDLWQLNGTRQSIAKGSRTRSGAFPIELPYRLINMYSIYGDTVLDPFSGTGTTSMAALIAGRNSVGYEIDSELGLMRDTDDLQKLVSLGNTMIDERLYQHLRFVKDRIANGKEIKHQNVNYGFPVMTAQERQARLFKILEVKPNTEGYEAEYVEIEKVAELDFSHKASA